MRNKKKILIFSPFFHPHIGGVERFSHDLAISLSRDFGFSVKIVTFNTENCADKDMRNGIHVYRLPAKLMLEGRFPVPVLSKRFFSLLSEVLKEDIDYYVINTRFFLSSLLGVLVSKINTKPLILIEHGSAHFTLNSKIKTAFGELYEHVISKITGGCCDLAFGVSKSCCDWLGHFHIEAADVVYNGIDTTSRETNGEDFASKLGIDSEGFIISYVGRIIKEKGLAELLEAFRILRQNHDSIYLVIAGDGSYLNELRTEYKSVRNAIFTGMLDKKKVYKLLAASEIFVHPSNFPEGLPSVILEAGLHECAIVATSRGGTEEIIANENHGVLIRDGNTKLIYEAIDMLINDHDKRRSMAANVYSRITKYFDRTTCAQKLVECIENLEMFKTS